MRELCVPCPAWSVRHHMILTSPKGLVVSNTIGGDKSERNARVLYEIKLIRAKWGELTEHSSTRTYSSPRLISSGSDSMSRQPARDRLSAGLSTDMSCPSRSGEPESEQTGEIWQLSQGVVVLYWRAGVRPKLERILVASRHPAAHIALRLMLRAMYWK